MEQTLPEFMKLDVMRNTSPLLAVGVIQVEEAELLRAVADTLDCPIPPFVPME